MLLLAEYGQAKKLCAASTRFGVQPTALQHLTHQTHRWLPRCLPPCWRRWGAAMLCNPLLVLLHQHSCLWLCWCWLLFCCGCFITAAGSSFHLAKQQSSTRDVSCQYVPYAPQQWACCAQTAWFALPLELCLPQ